MGHQRKTSALASGYRPWLDGLRAVAIVMVVAQHTLGSTSANLGYVGVGVFFSLSGYLITSLLLDELDVQQSISFSRFYLRRGARLLPAIVVVIVVCDLIFIVQGDFEPLRGSLAALTYTANYAQVLWDGSVVGYGPTWSLAVEEHFYLLWPVALHVMLRRTSLRTAVYITLFICLLSAVWRATLAAAGAPLILLSVGSLERADALLYGCAAAMVVRLGWRPSPWMAWASFGVVAVMPLALDQETSRVLVIGGAVLGLASAVAVTCLDYASPRWVRQVLSWRPAVVVGVLSYGIYLWHGPLMRAARTAGYDGRAWRAVAVGAAVLLAALSYRTIEAPIRTWARRRTEPPIRPQPADLNQR